jgi:hypothetical protein
MRATLDPMRRRNHLMRKRAKLFAHTQNTASQYNLQTPLRRIAKPQNRVDLLDRFKDPSVKISMAANLDMINAYDRVLEILRTSSPTLRSMIRPAMPCL